MATYLEKAKAMESDLKEWRRYLHQNPELGLDLPVTTKFIMDKLKSFGLEPKEISPSGIVCLIEGNGEGKTFMLRGDTDALPMSEENDLPYKSQKENMAHTCGHDLHATMLLGAAKLLNENRNSFKGTVKLMFQPGEETLQGAQSMIDAGLLESPKVDAALGMHVMLDGPVGGYAYGTGYMSSSSDNFKMTVTGKGCHGAMPHLGIDPINVVVNIYQSYQYLMARENPTHITSALSVGQLTAGSSTNIIPETAFMQGTLRTYDAAVREKMRNRMKDIAEQTAAMFGAQIDFSWISNVPSIISNPELVEELVGYIDGMDGGLSKMPNYKISPSEDFALVSEKVKSTYILLLGKKADNNFPHHSPYIIFDEDVMPIGAAVYAQCAAEWLNNN